ncbi:MAG: hypothetical protein HQM08_08185 [Candidatus Riflebacteria bacterium]|nr:hypothetical protein [Candidatus Riflebacteria bacterium]
MKIPTLPSQPVIPTLPVRIIFFLQYKLRNGKMVSGFTIMEITIAASIFLMVMVAVLVMFRSSTNSFNTGTWRISTQKNTQLFLSRLRENLEKANYATTIRPEGISSQTLDLFINQRWNNTSADCNMDKIAIFASIVKPYRAANPLLNTSEVRGKWSGVSLTTSNRTLTLVRTGNRSLLLMPTAFIFPAGGFDEDGSDINFTVSLSDVESLSINQILFADGKKGIEVAVQLGRRVGDQPPQALLSEKILAKLIAADFSVKTFSP